ncbi:MAG TPA: tetratricopeptide repeat protein [Chthoniobacteraceae bacterium]|jgi:outer membrane protein assembly factor BamD (BamD/ComL family)|nr:tetratricopeptide repeat protein [Chthoniobacteraceae bacterium]
MKLLCSLSLLVRLVLAGVLAGPALLGAPAYGQDAPRPRDVQDFDKAQQALAAGKLEEAAGLLERIPVYYPTSSLIPAAMVQLGELYIRMSQYDKAVKTLESATKLRNNPPEMKERALSLLAQAQSAKAAAADPKNPQQKPGATPATPRPPSTKP